MAKLSSRAILPIIRRFAMHYDPKLLENATQANSWSPVEIQWHFRALSSTDVLRPYTYASLCTSVRRCMAQHVSGTESPKVIEFLLVTSYSPVWHYLAI